MAPEASHMVDSFMGGVLQAEGHVAGPAPAASACPLQQLQGMHTHTLQHSLPAWVARGAGEQP